MPSSSRSPDDWPRLWGKYVSHHDAWRRKAWQELDTNYEWKVERDRTKIRGWLLFFAPRGWWDD